MTCSCSQVQQIGPVGFQIFFRLNDPLMVQKKLCLELRIFLGPLKVGICGELSVTASSLFLFVE